MEHYEQEWLEQLNFIVEQNLSNPDFMAADLVMPLTTSPAQLYRKVLKLTGKSPNSYIRLKRLTKAKELLEQQSYESVTKVALAVGYRHSNYFSIIFEKEFGKRPMDYFR